MSKRGGGRQTRRKKMHVWKDKMGETSGKKWRAGLQIFLAPRDVWITGDRAKGESKAHSPAGEKHTYKDFSPQL